MSWETSVEQSQAASVLSPHGRVLLSNGKASEQPIYPPYLKPLPAHLDSDDVDYLLRKGALSVPDTELRNAILRSYNDYIHPTLPILDLRALQASIKDPTRNGRISLPLFQAVMFAGSAWVMSSTSEDLDFSPGKQPGRLFIEKHGWVVISTVVILTSS